MAKNMNDQEDMPEDDGGTVIDPPAEESPQTICQKWFNDYLEDPLEADLERAAGAATVGCLGYEEGKTSTQLRVCRLEDARKIRGEYRGIQHCISTTVAAHSTGVTTNVTTYGDKEKALDGKLKAALEAIKAAKDGMGKVNTLICKLDAARKDGCNSEQRKAIEKDLPAVDGVGKMARFNAEVDAFKDSVGQLSEDADALFEMSIKYAGIQASTNVTSLQEMVATLKTDAEGLATDVTDQSAALDKKIADYDVALTEGISSLSTALYERHRSQRQHDCLVELQTELTDVVATDCATLDYASAKTRLKEICEEAVNTFNKTATCTSGESGNKFNPQDAPSC